MNTATRTNFEHSILREVKNLPEHDLEKILKLVLFLKKEIFLTSKFDESDSQKFWDTFGGWQDDRPAVEIINDIYGSRKSTGRIVEL